MENQSQGEQKLPHRSVFHLRPLYVVITIIGIISVGILFVFFNKTKDVTKEVFPDVLGTYIAPQGQITITRERSNSIRVIGKVTYPKPGNAENDRYTGKIDGVLNFSSSSVPTYTDPLDTACLITFTFKINSVYLSGASENCDVLLASFDGEYMKASELSTFKTDVHAGKYGSQTEPKYDKNGDVEWGEASWWITIYPKTDSSIIFYLDLNRGAPSYNSGGLQAIAIAQSDNTFDYSSDEYGECHFKLMFTDNNVTIETIDNKHDCGFGNGVIADAVYPRKTRTIPVSYVDRSGDTIYFKGSYSEVDQQTIGEDTQSLYMYYESEAEELSISELKSAIPALVKKLAVQYKEDPIYTGDITISIDAYLDVYKKRAPTDTVFVDAIRTKLFDTYGPCLGAPKEQCVE